MITDPDINYTTTPANLMKHASFMHKVGRLKHLPVSWESCSSPRRATSTEAEGPARGRPSMVIAGRPRLESVPTTSITPPDEMGLKHNAAILVA